MKLSIQPKKFIAALLTLVFAQGALVPSYAQFAAVPSVPSIKHPIIKPKFSGTGSGSLSATDKSGRVLGNCPLKHTDVSARISGYLADVTVKQRFENPFKEPIEAVYTFPLSDTGSVDEMVMKIGTRVIRGTIKERDEARALYEAAKHRGQTASLLNQERPNIFTQSLANIKPGQSIEITLHVVDVLAYEAGSFTFAFPTVVGPRYIPGDATGHAGTGWAPDTTTVPDASNITPPVVPEGMRAGHDLSLKVAIHGGLPISQINSKLHEIVIEKSSDTSAEVSLKGKATIPNRDFILSWQVASDKVQSGYLTHRDGKYGYFLLMLIPPKKVTPQTVAPREMIFVVDRSGSQSGRPIEKAKETMNFVLDKMNPKDTFQVISFSHKPEKLFEKALPANPEMIKRAKAYIKSLDGNGGTEMKSAVEEACGMPEPEHRLRIVTMMTDGYIGNDFQIVGLVKKLRGNSRWFPFGTGNSVNRFLIDNVAKEGGGEPDYVDLNASAEAVAKKFYDRISSPVLTDVRVSFEGLEVTDVFPRNVADVWAQKPLFITGRYDNPGSGRVVLHGYSQGKPYEQKLKVTLPEHETGNKVLGTIWARAQVDRLMSGDYTGAQTGQISKELKDEILRIALEHHIVTQYTSFVAIDETSGSAANANPKQVVVPVNMPNGVSYGKMFANQRRTRGGFMFAPGAPAPMPGAGSGPLVVAASPVKGAYLARQPESKLDSFVLGQVAASKKPAPPPRPSEELSLSDSGVSENEAGDKTFDQRKISHGKTELDAAELSKVGRDDIRLEKNKLAFKEVSQLPVVDGGKVRLRVKVKNLSKQTLERLKAVGFKVLSIKKDTLTIIGTLKLEKLSDLAKLAEVVSVYGDTVERLPATTRQG